MCFHISNNLVGFFSFLKKSCCRDRIGFRTTWTTWCPATSNVTFDRTHRLPSPPVKCRWIRSTRTSARDLCSSTMRYSTTRRIGRTWSTSTAWVLLLLLLLLLLSPPSHRLYPHLLLLGIHLLLSLSHAGDARRALEKFRLLSAMQCRKRRKGKRAHSEKERANSSWRYITGKSGE